MNKDSVRLIAQLREEIKVLKDRTSVLESYLAQLQESLEREDREAAEALAAAKEALAAKEAAAAVSVSETVDLSEVSFDALPEEEVDLPEPAVMPEPVTDPFVAAAPQDDKAAAAPQEDKAAAAPQDDKTAAAPQDDKTVIPSEAKESVPSPKPAVEVPAGNYAWRKDLPGLPVRDIRSAIALNDRVLFINNLFQQDAVRFQNEINTLNSLESFPEAENYLRANFPQWNYDSDIVYRFMMAVRRKLR